MTIETADPLTLNLNGNTMALRLALDDAGGLHGIDSAGNEMFTTVPSYVGTAGAAELGAAMSEGALVSPLPTQINADGSTRVSLTRSAVTPSSSLWRGSSDVLELAYITAPAPEQQQQQPPPEQQQQQPDQITQGSLSLPSGIIIAWTDSVTAHGKQGRLRIVRPDDAGLYVDAVDTGGQPIGAIPPPTP